MSLKVEGESCPVCHAYLFDEDDIVYCPICGAPHHRECYNSIGHCALEHLHGTENEYSREKQRKILEENQEDKKQHQEKAENPYSDTKTKILCPYCRELYNADEGRCPKCGNTNPAMARGFALPDPLGGTPENLDIGKGVTAKQAAGFVLSNAQRYVPKFARIKMGNKVSFNWAAFLFPEGWFLYRKIYGLGILALLLTVIFSLCSMPLAEEMKLCVDGLGLKGIELYLYLVGQINNFSVGAVILAAVSGLLNGILHILCGLFADAIYRGHVINSVSEIQQSGNDIGEEYRKRGNVNPLLFLIGIMASTYVPTILYGLAISLI